MGTRFIERGLPFIVLLVGGSFALKYFAEIRLTFRKSKLTPDEEQSLKKIMKSPEDRKTLEMEYEDLKKLDLDSWKNVRGPRPWENNDRKP